MGMGVVPIVDPHRFAVGAQPMQRRFVRFRRGREPARVAQQRIFAAQRDQRCDEVDVVVWQ